MQIDFATTATRRPEIIEETYRSFLSHLKGFNPAQSTLYINVDPLPTNRDSQPVIDAAKKFFGHVVANTPNNPSFPLAVKWCLSQPQSQYLFYLEDDWILDTDVDLEQLSDTLTMPNLACINLRAYNFKDGRIYLSPSLWRSDYSKVLASRITADTNPERQLWRKQKEFKGKQFGEIPIIRDIGRAWLAKTGMSKDGHFTTWSNGPQTSPSKPSHPSKPNRKPLITQKKYAMKVIKHQSLLKAIGVRPITNISKPKFRLIPVLRSNQA